MTATVNAMTGISVPRVTKSDNPTRHFVPKHSGKPDPAAHLSAEQLDEMADRLDAIRQEVLDSRGAKDAAYIRRVVAAQRAIELGSRAVLLFSGWKPAWILGTAGLSISKILDNMEIGHNVMHGQWDWMRDPKIHSMSWDWDNVTPAPLWKHSHNEIHHTYTNVLGRDNDLGYGIMRVDEDQRWRPFYLAQPLWNLVNACLFQYSIAIYDLELGKVFAGRVTKDQINKKLGHVKKKVGTLVTKEYIVWPLLSGPNFAHTITANLTADLVRNLWTHGVIVCGHFPEGIETFAKQSIEGETRGEWYLRQLIGSGNISGGKLTHLMTGNLSHQIEHHLFPDIPSNRYVEIAPKVRQVMEDYGLRYVTGPFLKQYGSSWAQCVKYSLPNGAWDEIRKSPVGAVRKGLKFLAGKSSRKKRRS